MQGTLHRCSDCGGGPVKPMKWRTHGPDGVETVKTRCSNCGAEDEVDKSELHW